MIDRIGLPNRRENETVVLTHGQREFIVTFGIFEQRVVEVFCSPSEKSRAGTDSQADLTDACIAISLLLQRGMKVAQLAAAFGEDRPEGMEKGSPSSILGRIACAGAELEGSLEA